MERGDRPVEDGAAGDSSYGVYRNPYGDVEAIDRGPDRLADDRQVGVGELCRFYRGDRA
jgi:hypothetical protein